MGSYEAEPNVLKIKVLGRNWETKKNLQKKITS